MVACSTIFCLVEINYPLPKIITMRILHVYKSALPHSVGGIEKVIDQISRGSIKQGFEVDVLALSLNTFEKTIDFNGYRIHTEKLNFEIASTGFSFTLLKRFICLSRQADIIHYHFPWPFMDLLHFLARIKKPTLVTYHSDIIRQRFLSKLYNPLQFLFLNSVNHMVATSPNYLATSKVLAKFSHKVTVIPIGLDKSQYSEPRQDLLELWKDKLGPKFFLFIGVIRYYKGLHVLLEALKGVDYPVAILGAGKIEKDLKERAEKLGLKNLHFLGYLPDDHKVALLTSCFGIIFPSHLRSEAFGISLLEGAMYGKPMISSEIGTGTTFINIDRETGLVVPPSDVVALQGAMRYLWEHPDEAVKMGALAEKRYWKLFTADQMNLSYYELYKKISQKNN